MTRQDPGQRALVVGRDGAEVLALHGAVGPLLPPGTVYLAMELDTSSQDPALAWGTELPVVRELVPPVDGSLLRPHDGSGAPSASMHPLPEDGDSWRAIVDVAQRYGAQLVVMAAPRQGWFARLFSGSAADDVLASGDVPVLLVPRPC